MTNWLKAVAVTTAGVVVLTLPGLVTGLLTGSVGVGFLVEIAALAFGWAVVGVKLTMFDG